MRAYYGGLPLGAVNSTRFTWGRTLTLNRAGVGIGFQWNCNFGEVLFRCSSQAECAYLSGLVSSNTASQEMDLIVYNDDGSRTDHAAVSDATFSGVRCTSLTWLDKPGAQFLTHRLFSVSFEWETLLGSEFALMTFSEKLTLSGGPPTIVVHEPINGRPYAQVTVPETGYRATQSGSAVGAYARPDIDVIAPLAFPVALTRRNVTYDSAERVGVKYRNYAVQWSFEFASATPLVGLPNEWAV